MTKTETHVITAEIVRGPWSGDKLGDFLDHPDQAQRVVQREACLVKYELDEVLFGAEAITNSPQLPEIHILTEASFEALYDPSLPTIGIDVASSFQGAEIVAFAARQRTAQGLPACNVVMLPTPTNCSYFEEYTHRPGRMVATTGIIVDAEGQVHYGELPTPVPIDVLETTQLEVLDICHRLQIPTLNPPELVREFFDKSSLPEIAPSLGIPSPDRWQPEDLASPHGPAEYVIKPAELSGGLGVRFFTRQEETDALRYYATLEAHNYAPIIETRAHSLPLYLEEDGQPTRYDWNARVLIAHGECIGMYIRAAKWGEAVNRCNGARALRIEDLASYFPAAEAAVILAQLTRNAQLLADRLPTGITGADIIITEEGNAQLLECNIGITGGITTIAQMQPDSKKLETADRLVGAWMSRFAKQAAPDSALLARQRWPKNTLLLLRGIRASSCAPYFFSELSLDTMADHTEKRQHYFSWLLHAQQQGNSLSEAKLLQVRTALFQQFPLETIGNIEWLFPWTGDTQLLQDFLDSQLAQWPDNPRIIAGSLFAKMTSNSLSHIKTIMNTPCPPAAKRHLERFVYNKLLTTTYPYHLDVDEQAEDDPWDIRSIYEVYFSDGYNAVKSLLNYHLLSAQSSGERDMLEELSLQLALAEQDIDEAKICSARIDSRDEENYTVFSVIDGYLQELVTTPEGLGFLLNYFCQHHQLLDAMRVFALAQSHASQDTEYTVASIFAAEAGNVLGSTTAEIRWFTAFLRQQVYLSTVPHPFLLHPQTSLQQFASLLWSMSNQRYANGLESMEHLKKVLADFDDNFGYDIFSSGEIPWVAPRNPEK